MAAANNIFSVDPYNRTNGTTDEFFQEFKLKEAFHELHGRDVEGPSHFLAVEVYGPQYDYMIDHYGPGLSHEFYDCLRREQFDPWVNWDAFEDWWQPNSPIGGTPSESGYNANNNTGSVVSASGYEGNVEPNASNLPLNSGYEGNNNVPGPGRTRRRERRRRDEPSRLKKLVTTQGNLILPKMKRSWQYRKYPHLLQYFSQGYLPMFNYTTTEFFNDLSYIRGYNYNSNGETYPDWDTPDQRVLLTIIPTGPESMTLYVYILEEFYDNHHNVLHEVMSRALRCLGQDWGPPPYLNRIENKAAHMANFARLKALMGTRQNALQRYLAENAARAEGGNEPNLGRLSAYNRARLPENVVRTGILPYVGRPNYIPPSRPRPPRERKTRKNR